MTNPEKTFHKIIKQLPNGTEGKMFGAKCIKAVDGKTAAFFWNECMVFKLDEKSQSEALKLNGVKIGSHLYASEKQMKGWVSIPEKYTEKWPDFANKAIEYVSKL